jgi:hypothetical protein
MSWMTTLPFLPLLNVNTIKAYHYARFEKGSRYYTVRLEKDLLNDWTVVLVNGRVKSKLGQNRTMAFPNFMEAFAYFSETANLRYQRGYQLTTYESEDFLMMHLILLHAPHKSIARVVPPKPRIIRKISYAIKPNKPNFIPSQQMGFTF